MRIENANVNGVASGIQMPMQKVNDSFSKNIQSQIDNTQKKMMELGDNEEMSVEDKMKKRQELQKQISALQNQLRQHQMEQRMQKQQKKGSSMDDMLDGSYQARKTSKGGTGMSSASMQAIISADSSIKQVKTQGAVKTQMEDKTGVLKSEIKLDADRGSSVEKKEEELAKLEEKANEVTSSQMLILSDVKKTLDEASKEEQKDSKSEDKNKTQKKDSDSKVDGDKKSSAVDDEKDVALKTEDSVFNDSERVIPEGATTSNSELVGSNVDVKL